MAPGMPPQGPPQGAPAQAPQPPQGAPQGQPNPSDMVAHMSDLFNQLGKLVGSSGLPPEDKQLLGQSQKAFEAFVASVSQPHGQPQQQKAPAPGGPMPANAAPNSKPAPNY